MVLLYRNCMSNTDGTSGYGIDFFSHKPFFASASLFFCVRLSASFFAFSLSEGCIFLPPKGRCLRVSNLSFVLPHILLIHFCNSLSLPDPHFFVNSAFNT